MISRAGGLAVLLLISSCGALEDGSVTPPANSAPSTLESSLPQLSEQLPNGVAIFADYPRYLWHKRRLAIATTNNGTEPLHVSAITLHTDHFDQLERESKNTVVPPGARIDIQVDFGELRNCEEEQKRANVELEIAVGDGPRLIVDVPFDAKPIDEIVKRECAVKRITDAVDISFADRWSIDGTSMSTQITLDSRGVAPVVISSIRGTEIFAMREASASGRLPLDLITESETVDVEIFVTRCDPHVVGQSTRTFEFKAFVGVGGDEPSLLVLDPSPQLREALSSMIAACIDQQLAEPAP